MKISLAAAFFLLILCLAGCDILYPPIKVQFADTTITAPNGSFVLYGTVWQTPLDSATLVRLRSEGYTGSTDKAPVIGAEVTATNGDTKLTATTDRLGRYVLVTKNSGTYSLTAKHYTTVTNEPISVDVRASSQKDIILRPAKEFVFPLAIGNKWIYNYTYSSGSGSGIETWEVKKKEPDNQRAKYTLSMIGEGFETFPQSKPYSYQFDMTVLVTTRYYIFQYGIASSDSPDTISRFVSNTKDTITFTNNVGTDISTRSYVHNIGHIYFYDYSGSPGSGRSSVKRSLRSYSFK